MHLGTLGHFDSVVGIVITPSISTLILIADRKFDSLHEMLPFKRWRCMIQLILLMIFEVLSTIHFRPLTSLTMYCSIQITTLAAAFHLHFSGSAAVTLAKFQSLGPSVPSYIEPVDLQMPCWNPQFKVDERTRAFTYRLLRDFNPQWRHIFRKKYNSVTLMMLARAIIRLLTLDFEVYEETKERHSGPRGQYMWATDLPGWKPFARRRYCAC